MFELDQRQKINTKKHMQISGLDPQGNNKIAKTLERRILSYAQETFMEVDSHSDSNSDSIIVFSDNSTKSNDSSIYDELYLPSNVLLSAMLPLYKVAFFHCIKIN